MVIFKKVICANKVHESPFLFKIKPGLMWPLKFIKLRCCYGEPLYLNVFPL